MNKQQAAQEIVNLMSHGGSFPGLWIGKPMDDQEVLEYVANHKHLPMQNGHTKNSLEMQNVRGKISRRVAKLAKNG